MNRAQGESSTRYVSKIGEEANLLKVKVRESGDTQEARARCWSFYEEMIGTLKNLPQGIKSAVRTKGLVYLEDLLQLVWKAEQSKGLQAKNTGSRCQGSVK